MTEQEKIIDKIRKLLALGQSPNEAEAASAITKAHALMVVYNLSIDSVDIKDTSIVQETFVEGNRIREYKKCLLSYVAKVNFCEILVHTYHEKNKSNNKTKINIVGKAHNVITCIAMANYLFDAIERLALQVKGSGKSQVASYKAGIAYNLIKRLLGMIKEDESEGSACTALVISNKAELNNYLNTLNAETKTVKPSPVTDYDAYRHGILDGNRISLNQQIKGTMNVALQIG